MLIKIFLTILVASLMATNAVADPPLTYDIRLDVGSDSPETDGYVYGKVIEAVEAQ
jgi:hypothetical protein